MEVHETSWPLMDREAMAARRNDCATEPSRPDQRHGSASHDQEWADFLRSYSQGGLDPTASSDNIGFGLMGVDDGMPAQFGAMNDFQEHPDPASNTTINNSLSSSMHDPNGAQHPFQSWPVVSNVPLVAYEQPPFHPAPWMAEPHHQQHPHHYEHQQPLTFGMPGREGLGIHMPPTSHPIDAQHAMHFGGPFIDHDSPIAHHPHDDYKHDMGMPHHLPPSVHDDLFAGEDLDDREASADPADPCYAQLLYQCLKEAPDHTLSLRELYEWVQQHSQKAKDPKNRGWQNSVRHNLSMNAAFQRVAHSAINTHLPKKGSLWRLTPEALRSGVISTTRYRKDPKRKPDTRRSTPALNRQTSGAKGGRATRDATRARQRERDRRARFEGWRSASPPASGVVTPTSPYFGMQMGVGGAYEMLPTSAPQTPPEWEHPFHQAKPQHPFDVQGGAFEFLPLDMGQGGGLFGNSDAEMQTPTPSLVTEGSWPGEEGGLLPPSSVVVEGEGGY
ncbi:hypothetical protein PRZ48_005415 [Zasmidium cellare]|uniref:Fork-head domain-containing protein n=1 Tax=Zasmidium cellare TaxID=395010 RepID=A0ABR0ESA6_ZASCE|nr:hypothetical protein PRZ48_005415 [Zasmidium cellare]